MSDTYTDAFVKALDKKRDGKTDYTSAFFNALNKTQSVEENSDPLMDFALEKAEQEAAQTANSTVDIYKAPRLPLSQIAFGAPAWGLAFSETGREIAAQRQNQLDDAVEQYHADKQAYKEENAELNAQRKTTNQAWRNAYRMQNFAVTPEQRKNADELMAQAETEDAKLRALGGRADREVPIGAIETAAGGTVNAVATVADLAEQSGAYRSSLPGGQLSTLLAAIRRAKGEAVPTNTNAPMVAEKEPTVIDRLHNTADELSARGSERITGAKAGRGQLEQMLIDAEVSGIQMAGDALINTVAPGAGLAAMGVRAFGSAAQEARQRGADVVRQAGYGAAVAAVELISEKMFDGLSGIYGKGMADDIVEKVIEEMTTSKGGQAVLKWLSSGVEEGLEEVFSGLIDPALEAIIDGKTGYNEDTAADILHSFLVGGFLGLVGGSVEAFGGGAEAQQGNAEYQQYQELTQAQPAAQQVAQQTVGQQAEAPADPLMQLAQETAASQAETRRPLSQEEMARILAEDIGIGENGARMVGELFASHSQQDSAADFVAGFNAVYNAAKEGRSIDSVTIPAAQNLTDAERQIAYNAGQQDAIAAAPKTGYDIRVAQNDDGTYSVVAKNNSTGTEDRIGRYENMADAQSDAKFFEQELVGYHPQAYNGTVKEETNNGRTQVRNENQERGDGMGAGEQARGIPRSAEARRAEADARRKSAEGLRNQIAASQDSREVSAASLGIPGGSESTMLRTVPDIMKTDGMRSSETDAKARGYTIKWFSGDNATDGGIERAAVDPDTRQMWICVDDTDATAEQLYQHEKYHTLPEETRAQVAQRLLTDRVDELNDLIESYVEDYGWAGRDTEYVTEEILADAYAGIDVYAGIRDYYEGATRLTGDVQNAVSQYAAEGQQTRGPPTGESGETRFSENLRRSDRPNRRRALEPDEMVNEFKDKINWPAYYQRLTNGEYNPDYFEDGDRATMLLDGNILTLEMQPNGEFSVIKMEGAYDNEVAGYRKTTDRRNAEQKVSGERSRDSQRSNAVEPGKNNGDSAESEKLQISERRSQSSADVFYLTDDQRKNYDYNENQDETGSTLKTLKGSAIKRSKYGVGKEIGGTIYLHRDYVDGVIPADVYEAAQQTLQENFPDFDYNCVEYNPKTQTIRFDEAPGFDTEREPVVGDYVVVNPDGTTRKGHTDYIWHHKWLWVKDDYKGFDVREAWEWSRQWLNTLSGNTYDVNGKQYSDRGVADGNGIGRWNAQLEAYGLPTEEEVAPVEQKHTSRGTSINTTKIPVLYTRTAFQPDTVNIDIGAGVEGTPATAYLEEQGVESMPFDPFNRSIETNKAVTDFLQSGMKADTATCSNCLNVIDNAKARANVILEMAKAIKPDGTAYFTVYSNEENLRAGKAGEVKAKPDQWQEFRAAKTYIPEIEQYFDDVKVKNGVIIARKPKANLPKATWQIASTEYTDKSGKKPYAKDQAVRFSRKLTADDDLRRQNEALRERAEYWKGQTRRTTEITARAEDAKKAARDLVKSYDSTVDAAEIAPELKSLTEYVMRGGDDFTWSGLKERAQAIAREIVNSAEVLRSADDGAFDEVRALLKRPMKISPQDAHDVTPDGWGAWRNSVRDRVNVSINGDGTPVDTVYQQLSEMMPGMFPEDITHPADQLLRMVDLMNNLTPVYENPYSYNMAEAIEYCANDIIDRVLGEDIRQTPPTFADKAAARLAAEKARGAQKVAEVREQKNAEIAALKERNAWETAQRLAQVRAQRDAKIEALKERYAEKQQAARDRRADSAARTKLLKILKRLMNKKLPAVSSAWINEKIGVLDTVAKSITGKGVENLVALRDWYEEQKTSNPDFIADAATEAKIARLAKTQISDLTPTQVQELTEVLLNFEHEINSQRQLLESEDKRDTRQMVLESMYNVEEAKGSKKTLADWLATNTLSPVRLVKRLVGYNADDPLLARTKELADGQRRMMDYQMRAERLFSRWANDTKLMNRLRSKERVKITGYKNGKAIEVEITPDMRMALYLHSLNDENMKHIANGGVTIPNIDLYLKGDLGEAYARGITVKLTSSNVRSIAAGMSAEERAYARAAHDYFNGMSRDEINAVSEALVGYSIAGVEDYFPIETDRNFTKSDIAELKRDGTIEGMGFLKERVHASNAINLVPLTDVLNRSIKNHAKYVGLAIPIRNMSKIWGMNAHNDMASEDNGLRQAIGHKWGERGVNAVEQMITDLQNSYHRADEAEKLLAKIRSNYAGAVLTLNASVALKQAASYPTAAAVLGWEPLVKALGNFGRVDLDLINKYTPLQWYRSQGYSTQELGDIRGQKGFMDKVLGASVRIGGRDVPILNWIQGIDLATTRKLWKASEYYVRQQSPDLSVGSDEYYRAVADIYNRVIEETQPNYTTMQRPQLLRSNNQLLQSLVMFKTQPFQNFGILYDALGELSAAERAAKNGDDSKLKQAKKNAANAVTSNLVSAAVFAAMTMAWALARRKKDKYEDKDGNFSPWAQLGKDILSSEFGMIPFGTDAYNLLASWVFDEKYYGMTNITSDSVSGALDSMKTAFDTLGEAVTAMLDGDDATSADPEKIARKLFSAAKDVSKLFGIPLENVVNLVTAVYSNVASAVNGEYVTAYTVLRMTKNMDSSASKSAAYDLLYKASRHNNRQFQELKRMMIEDGFKEKNIDAAMKKRAEK